MIKIKIPIKDLSFSGGLTPFLSFKAIEKRRSLGIGCSETKQEGVALSDLSSANEDDVLLTRSQLARWKAERLELEDEVRKISLRISEIDQRLAAAEVILKASARNEAQRCERDAAGSCEEENMADATVRIVGESSEPVSYKELLPRLREDPSFAQKLTDQPNYIYTLTKRLVTKGVLSRKGKSFVVSK